VHEQQKVQQQQQQQQVVVSNSSGNITCSVMSWQREGNCKVVLQF
jgi:hypothetical protein